MEMLFQRPALSQKFPLPVPACSHRTATGQDCNQASRALRPYTNTRAKKESAEGESEQPWEDQALMLPGSAAVLGLALPPPLHAGTAPVAPEKVSKKVLTQTGPWNVLYFV